MGGILSFPLLCLANYSLCKAVGLEDDQFLINGDDLLARITVEQFNQWKELGPKMGLTPSLGKNYLSDSFGLINSQMYLSREEKVVVCGKLSLIAREGKPLAECYSYAKVLYPSTGLESLFKILNTPLLRRTPRSLRVPVRWGGLSSRFENGFDQTLAKKVYLFYLLRKTVNNKVRVPGTSILFVPLPVFVSNEKHRRMCEREKYSRIGRACYQWRFFDPPNIEKEILVDLTHGELEHFIRSSPVDLKPILDSRVHISNFPPLDRVSYDWRPIPEKNWLAFKSNLFSSLVTRLHMIAEGKDVDLFDFDPETTFEYPPFEGPLDDTAPDLPSFGRPEDILSLDSITELINQMSDVHLNPKRARFTESELAAFEEDSKDRLPRKASRGGERPEKVQPENPSIPRCLPLPGVENQEYGWSPPCFGLVVPSDHFFQEPSSQIVRHGLGNLTMFHQKKVERTVFDWSVLDSVWNTSPDLSDDENWEISFKEAMQRPADDGCDWGVEWDDGE